MVQWIAQPIFEDERSFEHSFTKPIDRGEHVCACNLFLQPGASACGLHARLCCLQARQWMPLQRRRGRWSRRCPFCTTSPHRSSTARYVLPCGDHPILS